jgi:membrane-bound lytic murein transglycosylase B
MNMPPLSRNPVFSVRTAHGLRLWVVFLSLVTGLLSSPLAQAQSFEAFLGDLRQEALGRGIRPQTLDRALAGLEPDATVIALTQKQSEFVKPIWDYLNGALGGGRIDKGQALLKTHKALLTRIEQHYGVDRGVLLGIWGMESNFGGFSGDKNVIRSLASLASVNYRGRFFRDELLIALTILDKGLAPPEGLRGSWAGAMGQTQFMPSSFMAWAVDQDGDGRRNIWTSIPDSLGSTAHFLKGHGWVRGLPWGVEIALPAHYTFKLMQGDFAAFAKAGVKRADGRPLPAHGQARLFFPASARGPVFLVTTNFDVIRHYNASDAYALAVAHLGDRIKGGKGLVAAWPVNEPQLDQDGRIELQKRLTARGYDVGEADGRIGSKTRAAIRQEQIKHTLVPDGWPSPAFLTLLRQ